MRQRRPSCRPERARRPGDHQWLPGLRAFASQQRSGPIHLASCDAPGSCGHREASVLLLIQPVRQSQCNTLDPLDGVCYLCSIDGMALSVVAVD